MRKAFLHPSQPSSQERYRKLLPFAKESNFPQFLTSWLIINQAVENLHPRCHSVNKQICFVLNPKKPE